MLTLKLVMKSSLLLNDEVLQMFLLIFGLLTSVSVDAKDYYCDENSHLVRVSGNTTGDIITLFEGDTFYRNNQNCQWLIDAGADNARIQLTVKKSQLEWAPEGAICIDLYDYIDIKDGNSTTSKSIAVWCGYKSPRSVVSTGRYLLITFKSDPRNHYKYGGVQLTYNVFESAACPVFYSSPSDSQFCYSLVNNQEVNWNTAQDYCNFDQANLVTIHSETEHNFLKNLVSGSGAAWIGLSKIISEGTFSWIDDSSLNYIKFDTDLAMNSDEDCISFDFTTGLWRGNECLRFKSKFFCKTNKGKPTLLFDIPEKVKTTKVATKAPITIILASVFTLFGFILLVIVVIIVYVKCFKGRNQHDNSQRATSRASRDNADASVGPKHAPTTTSNRRSCPDAQRNVIELRIHPSAPSLELSSPLEPPPTYEEAVNEPVFFKV